MHVNALDLPEDSIVHADLCIVGAGAAGIAMAADWLQSKCPIVLLEAGGFELDDAIQDSYRAEIAGAPYLPLDATRLHYFGGTSNIWGGLCMRFDADDFLPRSWVPGSGWTIELADVEPFYAMAEKVLQICTAGPRGAARSRDPTAAGRPLPFDPGRITSKLCHYSPPTRLGPRYKDELVRSRNVRLFTAAKVLEIVANEALTEVDSIRFTTPDRRTHAVRARHYVLACGAIENARLLLASNRQHAAGLANWHDQVGRYFMDHPSVITGAHLHLRTARPMQHYWHEFQATRPRAMLCLTAEQRRAHQILNCTVELDPNGGGSVSEPPWRHRRPDSRTFLSIWKQSEAANAAGGLPTADPVTRTTEMSFQCEPAPNPDSRVLLSGERDLFGMPRVRLDWRVGDLESRTVYKMCELLRRETRRARIGDVIAADWLPRDARSLRQFMVEAGFHPMGTTRMHSDPRHGVVDRNCRVHGLSNLWIAGASVFTTGSAAHPTLTLVALALRLSQHLKTHFD